MLKRYGFEFFGLSIAAASALILSHFSLDGLLLLGKSRTAFHYTATILSGTTLYLLMRCLLSRIPSTIFTVAALTIAYLSSYYKAKFTRFPLSFNDITSVDNIFISLKFLKFPELAIILLIILSFFILFVFHIFKNSKSCYKRILVFLTLLTFASIAHSQYRQQIVEFLDSQGVTYQNWNPVDNFNYNGVFIHLLQTSARALPEKADAIQRNSYTQLRKAAGVADHPKNVILILCESCWYDSSNFKEIFEPLFNLQPAQMRALSPIFGGGTPNASFEMITGLPVTHPAIYGIFYQEYGELLSNTPDTIPYLLGLNGIKSYSMHNFSGHMYKRSLVEPKLGFDRFIGLDQMINDDKENYFPRDRVLYRATKKLIGDRSENALFLHLATVHAHGPYAEVDNDGGRASFSKKLSDTITDASEFIEFVMNLPEESVVLLYGDHKPPLWKLFEGKSSAEIADVPMLLFDKNSIRRTHFEKLANDKPFYCIGALISHIYYGITLPSSHFTEQACYENNPEHRKIIERKIPQWVYHEALFAP